MEIAIGPPNTVPGATGRQLTDWARAANDRIRLATTVMLGPLRGNPALVAKQAPERE